MDRQAWIAVILSIIGLVLWEIYFVAKYPAAPGMKTVAVGAAPASATTAAASAPPLLTAAAKPEVVIDSREATAAPSTGVAEQIQTIHTPQIDLRFTNLGGGIAEAIPLGHQNLAENGENVKLNHAGQIAIGAITFQGADPAGKPLPAGEDRRLPYNVRRDGNTVICERTEPSGLKITKEYSLDWQGQPKQIPAIDLKVTFTNTGAQPYHDAGYYIYAGSSAPIHRRDLEQYTAFDWLSDGGYHTDNARSFSAGSIPLVGVQTRAAREVITQPVKHAAWVAVKNQFYATVVTPLAPADADEAPAQGIWAQRFDLALTPQDAALGLPPLHAVDAALEMPGLQLAPGQSATQVFQIYAGPKYYSRLDHLGHQEQELMDFGKFKIVSITLLFLMNTFKGWLGNYGLAIIVLTLLVKTILFPLQNKANKSMKRMAILGPKMAELKEKYKDDQTRQSAETMKLYKEYGINPLGGCLPMVVQMPIFFGFLYMLYTAAELRNASFLWVHDLSQPDTVAHLLGFSINILPILMIGSQFWQMSLTPRTGDPSQQKMMMFMPLVFGFFCYNFAAALALYYTMQGVLTIGQLYLTRNQPMPVLTKKLKPGPEMGARGGLPGFGKASGGGSKRPKL
jgi:YidC/Oxa1 family membrane protein insertase